MSGDKSDGKRNWSALAMSWKKALAYNSEEYENSPVPGQRLICGVMKGLVVSTRDENLVMYVDAYRKKTWDSSL